MNNHNNTILNIVIITIFILFTYNGYSEELPKVEHENKKILKANLEECIRIALENNRQRQVSTYAVEIAEAQHKQALSSYWPQVATTISAFRMDEDHNFIFPAQHIKVGLLSVPVPEQDLKLFDRDILLSTLGFIYPLYTGGERSSIVKQAEIGVKAAKESVRKTDLNVVFDVKRMYYGANLTTTIRKLGEETLERFTVTLELTERLYKTSSGTVKKTDYLKTQVIACNIRSLLEVLKSNEDLAKAALINSMGMDWNTELEISETDIPDTSFFDMDISQLIADTYQFSPDWSRIQYQLEATEAKIKEAKSGHLPVIALTGSINHIGNSYSKGLVTEENVNSSEIGLVVNVPLFTGFRTTHEVQAAKANLKKLQAQEIFFHEGIALQVKDVFLQIARAQGQARALLESFNAAVENRELTIRAYNSELVETGEVIESQFLESLVKAQYQKALHDIAVNRAKLDFIIGKEVKQSIE